MAGEAASDLEFMDYDVTFGARKTMKKRSARSRRHQYQQQQKQQQQRRSDQDIISSVFIETDWRSEGSENNENHYLYTKWNDLLSEGGDRQKLDILGVGSWA